MAETEMVERVARAISLAGTQTEDMWQAFLPEALSAIKAMREPVVAMTQAGDETLLNKQCPPRDASDTYRAMIDAALSQPSKD